MVPLHSVHQFVEVASEEFDMSIGCSGEGSLEKGTVMSIADAARTSCSLGDVIGKVEFCCRPTEIDTLFADATKAKGNLGWIPKNTLRESSARVVEANQHSARCGRLIKPVDFQAYGYNE